MQKLWYRDVLWAAVLWIGLFANSIASAGDVPNDPADAKKTTQQVLKKFSEEMQTLCNKYSLEKHKDVRERGLQECQQVFQKNISAAELPKNQTMGATLKTLIDNLEINIASFRMDKMEAPRSMYTQACFLIFRKEFPTSTDFPEIRTTQKAFELLISLLTTTRDGLRKSPPSIQTMAYGAVNEMVGGIFTAAGASEGDALEQLDKNLIQVRKAFPVSVEALKVSNQAILSILEGRAKEIQLKTTKRK
jgi:hypothetical protein